MCETVMLLWSQSFNPVIPLVKPFKIIDLFVLLSAFFL